MAGKREIELHPGKHLNQAAVGRGDVWRSLARIDLEGKPGFFTRRMPGQAIRMDTSRRVISMPSGENTKRTGSSATAASAWRRALRNGATAHQAPHRTSSQSAATRMVSFQAPGAKAT